MTRNKSKLNKMFFLNHVLQNPVWLTFFWTSRRNSVSITSRAQSAQMNPYSACIRFLFWTTRKSCLVAENSLDTIKSWFGHDLGTFGTSFELSVFRSPTTNSWAEPSLQVTAHVKKGYSSLRSHFGTKVRGGVGTQVGTFLFFYESSNPGWTQVRTFLASGVEFNLGWTWVLDPLSFGGSASGTFSPDLLGGSGQHILGSRGVQYAGATRPGTQRTIQTSRDSQRFDTHSTCAAFRLDAGSQWHWWVSVPAVSNWLKLSWRMEGFKPLKGFKDFEGWKIRRTFHNQSGVHQNMMISSDANNHNHWCSQLQSAITHRRSFAVAHRAILSHESWALSQCRQRVVHCNGARQWLGNDHAI